MNNTTDLSKFGYRELDMAGDLLKAIGKGLPDDFNDDEITVMFNPNSGYVFLTNSDYQVAMVDDDGYLYSYYYTTYNDYEGSFEELKEMYEDDPSDWQGVDIEYLEQLAKDRNIKLKAKVKK